MRHEPTVGQSSATRTDGRAPTLTDRLSPGSFDIFSPCLGNAFAFHAKPIVSRGNGVNVRIGTLYYS